MSFVAICDGRAGENVDNRHGGSMEFSTCFDMSNCAVHDKGGMSHEADSRGGVEHIEIWPIGLRMV